MNKGQLLAWAVREVKVWPNPEKDDVVPRTPEGVAWLIFDTGAPVLTGEDDCRVTRDEWNVAKIACGLSAASSMSNVAAPVTAHSILEAAGGHMRDRAATYDKPEGERSMWATVDAFRAITGHNMTEEQGWLFMQLLKAVRSQQGAYRADSYEDGAAYVALAGEAAARERGSNKAEG